MGWWIEIVYSLITGDLHAIHRSRTGHYTPVSLHPLIVTRARSISVANVNQRVAVVA